MMAVGAGTEHCREAGAGVLAQFFAEIPPHLAVGEFHELAVGEPHAAHVERVGKAVLAGARAGDIVAAAAIVGRVIVDRAHRRTGLGEGGRHLLAHPMRDRFRHRAAHDRGRRHGDAGVVGQQDALEPDHVGRPAAARRARDRGQRLEHGDDALGHADLAGGRHAGRIGLGDAREVGIVEKAIGGRSGLARGRPRTRQRHAGAA